MKKNKFILFLFCLVLCDVWNAAAGPARRGIITKTQPDGTTIQLRLIGDEFGHAYALPDGTLVKKDENGCYRPFTMIENACFQKTYDESRSAMRRLESSNHLSPTAGNSPAAPYRMNDFSAQGTVRGIILLVAFKNVPFCTDSITTHELLSARYNTPKYQEQFSYSFFSQAYNEQISVSGNITGSARDYFRDQSLGMFEPTFDVFGPITLDNDRVYYGGNDRNGRDANARGMVKDACQKAFDMRLTDFKDYDNDGDGYVDYVYIVYAGNDEAQFGSEECIWAHSWNLSTPLDLGGMKISQYACSGELLIDSQDCPAGIGTFVHEFSHVIGLPDFYNTTIDDPAENDFCMDYWSIMDYGQYALEGYCPVGYTSFERYSMGWISAKELITPGSIALLPTDEAPSMYRAFVNDKDTTSYFVFETIQKTSWNNYRPNYGLMITGVNYNASLWATNLVNKDKKHHRYHIVPANNEYSYQNENNQLFGKDNFTFGPETTPASVTQFGDTLFKPLTNITRHKDGLCTFDFMGGANGLDILPSNDNISTTVYTIEGKQLHLTISNSLPLEEQLPKGIFIITQNGTARKIYIRE